MFWEMFLMYSLLVLIIVDVNWINGRMHLSLCTMAFHNPTRVQYCPQTTASFSAKMRISILLGIYVCGSRSFRLSLPYPKLPGLKPNRKYLGPHQLSCSCHGSTTAQPRATSNENADGMSVFPCEYLPGHHSIYSCPSRSNPLCKRELIQLLTGRHT